MTDHDQLFKQLITTFFVEFIELFLPQVATYLDPSSLESLDKEIFTDVTSGEQHQVELEKVIPEKKEEAMQLLTDWEINGMRKRELELIQLQIKHRLGELDPELEARVKSLTSEQINSLMIALFDITTVEQLKEWLDANAKEAKPKSRTRKSGSK